MPINKETKGTRAPASNNVLTSGREDLVKGLSDASLDRVIANTQGGGPFDNIKKLNDQARLVKMGR